MPCLLVQTKHHTPVEKKENKKTMVSTTRKVLMLGSFYGTCSGRKLGRRKNSGVLHETVAASITTATTCGVRGLFTYHCAVRWWRWLVVVAMVVVGRGRSGGLFRQHTVLWTSCG